MTTPTRRISFYLKPAAVKSEQEACNYLDSLPASERRPRATRGLSGWASAHKAQPSICLLDGRMARGQPPLQYR